jgi:hypothetical protein
VVTPPCRGVTVAESRSLSQSRNSDNEYFASVFKLARFCRAACVLPHRRPAPGPPSHGWRRLRRPCPVAAGRRACPADFEQVAVNCQPEGSGRRRAGCRAVTRTQLGLPARRRTTAAVTVKVRVAGPGASVAGCPSHSSRPVPLLFRLAGRQNIECEKVHYESTFKLNLKYASGAINLNSDPPRRAAGGPRRPSESVARKWEVTMMP